MEALGLWAVEAHLHVGSRRPLLAGGHKSLELFEALSHQGDVVCVEKHANEQVARQGGASEAEGGKVVTERLHVENEEKRGEGAALWHSSGDRHWKAQDGGSAVGKEIRDEADQGGVNSEALELFDQEDVRHRVVGLAEVQEGGVEAVPALTPATGTARVVVVLQAAEEEDEVVSGAVGAKAALVVRQRHLSSVHLVPDLVRYQVLQQPAW